MQTDETLNRLRELYKTYGLSKDDVFSHKHYTIITRQGIDKIQAKAGINIEYDAIVCEPEFAVIKAKATKGDARIETFGSAKYGGKEWVAFDKQINGKNGKFVEHGNTEQWYIAEMAEKRAMSRAVLKITGFYELGVFGEDEADDFKKSNNTQQPSRSASVKQLVSDAMFEKMLEAIANGKGSAVKARLEQYEFNAAQQQILRSKLKGVK